MITPRFDTLSFTFPEIARRVRLGVERRIRRVASELPASSNRAGLLADIEASPMFSRLGFSDQEIARTKVRTWTPAHVEAVLREVIVIRGGLNTDAFTELTINFLQPPLYDPKNPLSTEMGELRLHSVDEFAEIAPAAWVRKGGVIVPLAPSQSLGFWLSSAYRFAVQIGAGKINALTGKRWRSALQRDPQNYVVTPSPPWGANCGMMRIGTSDWAGGGGIQFEVTPMCPASHYREENAFFMPPDIKEVFMKLIFARMICSDLAGSERRQERLEQTRYAKEPIGPAGEPIGRPEIIQNPYKSTDGAELLESERWLKQGKQRRYVAEPIEHATEQVARPKIVEDPYKPTDWDGTQKVRCYVHPCDSVSWRQFTAKNPSHPPLAGNVHAEIRPFRADPGAKRIQAETHDACHPAVISSKIRDALAAAGQALAAAGQALAAAGLLPPASIPSFP